MVIKACANVLGEEHSSTLNSMVNLALSYWHEGQSEKAEELRIQVIGTQERVQVKEHPITLRVPAFLAQIMNSQGRDEETLNLITMCVNGFTIRLGAQHPDTKQVEPV